MIDIRREKLITLKEAAGILRVTYQSVLNYCKAGLLESVRMKGIRYTTIGAIQCSLDRSRQDTDTNPVPVRFTEPTRPDAERVTERVLQKHYS